jgi:hypothetical protein
MEAVNAAEAQRRQLLDVLLNTPDLARRYQQQVTFRNAVDVLIDTLPLHVQAMAKAADQVEFRREQMIEALNRTSGYGQEGWEWDRQ